MDDSKKGTLSLSLKKSEMLILSDGESTIELNICDRFKQPIACRVRIRSSKRFEIKRKPDSERQK